MKQKILILGGFIVFCTLFSFWRISKQALPASSDLRTSILQASKIDLKKGLPHQFFEPEALKQELDQENTVQIADFPFYTPSISLTDSQKEKIISLLSSDGSIRPFKGEKDCGGFHPDFAVSWTTDNTDVHALICFGCSEIIFTSGPERYRFDLSPPAKKELKKLLNHVFSDREPHANFPYYTHHQINRQRQPRTPRPLRSAGVPPASQPQPNPGRTLWKVSLPTFKLSPMGNSRVF